MSNLQPGTTMYRIGQLERVTSELRQDVRELRGALELAEQRISDLERLRPTCVICLDATAVRQTVRGPACTDCVGDMPDDDTGADPDRPETWAFPGAAESGRDGEP